MKRLEQCRRKHADAGIFLDQLRLVAVGNWRSESRGLGNRMHECLPADIMVDGGERIGTALAGSDDGSTCLGQRLDVAAHLARRLQRPLVTPPGRLTGDAPHQLVEHGQCRIGEHIFQFDDGRTQHCMAAMVL